jgi:hypothetical protein
MVHIINEAGTQGLWVRQTATSEQCSNRPPDDGTYVGLTFSRDGNYVYFVRA